MNDVHGDSEIFHTKNLLNLERRPIAFCVMTSISTADGENDVSTIARMTQR